MVPARLGLVGSGWVRSRAVWRVRHGRCGRVGLGEDWFGNAGVVRTLGQCRWSTAGMSGARHGEAQVGMAGLDRRSADRWVMVGQGTVWYGAAGTAGQGGVR